MRLLSFFLILGFTSLLSCESSTHVDIDAVIEEKVQERLDEFQRVVQERCSAKAIEEASLIADSIIFERARRQKDTLLRPLKPLRPNQPELKVIEDSLPLSPLFDTSSIRKIKN